MIDSLLNKLTIDNIDVFVAPNCNLSSTEEKLMEFKRDKLSFYLDNSRYNQLIDLNAKRRHLKGIGVLYANGAYAGGGFFKNKWVFDDTNSLHLVQDWVDEHDGHYSLLMLCCYASENVSAQSHKSVLLIPDGAYTKNKIPERAQSRLYIPSIGFIRITNLPETIIDDISGNTAADMDI